MPDLSAAHVDAISRQHSVSTLYNEHHSWLHSWLRKKLGCSQRAADLAHDAFIRVLLLSEPQSIKEPRAFLATTANRLLIDGARRRRLEQAYLEALGARVDEAAMPNPEAIHAALQLLENLAQMLAGLPPKQREAFLLNRLDGLTYSEIALRLEISVSSVKNYIAAVLVHCYKAMHGADPLS